MDGERAAQSRLVACRWVLTGQVQGVGFRPFVYRLAQRHNLTGWVRNEVGQVEVVAEGEVKALRAFGRELITEAPPLAKAVVYAAEFLSPSGFPQFAILASRETADRQVHVPPDYFTCDGCLAELRDLGDRRYRYPFINCTQCGPRYTLIERLPYDRAHTSMAGFALCSACQREYGNPLDRRFHAEPVACPACGPTLRFVDRRSRPIHGNAESLEACIEALRGGAIVAVKGIGGFHLMCDAHNRAAVQRLRAQKPRPHKPLAVMFPMAAEDGLDRVREVAYLGPEEAEWLRSPLRPIVLVTKKAANRLAVEIAPGLSEIGAMLPYSPLHHLILKDFAGPLVATSANLSGEPVLTEGTEVQTRLQSLAPHLLDHNRPIVRPADDSVFRVIGGRARPLRLGRGAAPVELSLVFSLPIPLLAVGAHMKNTIALGWQDRVVVSPHIGDMGSRRSLSVFQQVVADLQRLYAVAAQQVVCDAHPDYATSQWAERAGLPVRRVFHHHAHAAAIAGEYPQAGRWLVFTWDGVGFGEDHTLWGGEALLGHPGAWRRVAAMRPFRLPGGEQASREPWRSAASVCWEIGVFWRDAPAQASLLHRAWERGLNAPWTSAVGRLFDAASALTGLVSKTTYEGHGPMLLEAACADTGPLVPLPVHRTHRGLWEVDWAPLIPMLLDDRLSVGARAAGFHLSLAQALLEQALCIRQLEAVDQVGLGGGVFQNRILTETAVSLLESHGFTVRLAAQIPINDAGISFGQIIEAGAHLA